MRHLIAALAASRTLEAPIPKPTKDTELPPLTRPWPRLTGDRFGRPAASPAPMPARIRRRAVTR